MITNAFDTRSEPIITSEMIYGERKYLCKTCIVTYSKIIYDAVLSEFPCEKVTEIEFCNGNVPIYLLFDSDSRIGFYLSGIGSAVAASSVIETNWLTGAKKFVMFGSAGCLDRAKTAGKYVVPTRAYRDEGMSYHYAPPADYIDVPGAAKVAEVFDKLSFPYAAGGAWTTDAMLRETRDHAEARKAEGCLAVEMELAGVQSVCSFHGWELYDFLVPGDVLDAPSWDIDGLHEANHSLRNFYLALELAKIIDCT